MLPTSCVLHIVNKMALIDTDYLLHYFNTRSCALGGVVVSVLATGPKVAGSNPAEDDGF
jgi:hypothetical protein